MNTDVESLLIDPSDSSQDDQPNKVTPKPTNTHITQTRAKSRIYKPKVFSTTKEPNSAREALQHKQ